MVFSPSIRLCDGRVSVYLFFAAERFFLWLNFFGFFSLHLQIFHSRWRRHRRFWSLAATFYNSFFVFSRFPFRTPVHTQYDFYYNFFLYVRLSYICLLRECERVCLYGWNRFVDPCRTIWSHSYIISSHTKYDIK